MSEHEIQVRLFWDHLSSSEFLMPNYTPRNWFECDLFRITKAGYFYEYEIKLSVSDFRADRDKSDYCRETSEWLTKHTQIAGRLRGCPSRFYYVVPEEIAEKVASELPEWAGLLVLRKHLATIKQAPVLHRNKISRAIIRQARHSMAARYWGLFLGSSFSHAVNALRSDIYGLAKSEAKA